MPVQTVPDLFLAAVHERPRADCFATRSHDGRWEPMASSEALRRVQALRHGLLSLGVKPGDRVALLAENRVEWALTDLGIQAAGAVTVPVYPTLLPDAIGGILADCAPVAVFVSTGDQAAKIHQVRGDLPSIKDVVAFDRTELPDILAFTRLLEIGQNIVDRDPPAPGSPFTAVDAAAPCSIIYTSGTTGTPKGVVLSHRNFVSNVLSIQDEFPFERMDRCLSFLPLSHVLERMAGFYTMLFAGVGIYYAERMDTVPRDILEVKPQIMISVPRLYEKIYAKALGTAMGAGWPKRDIFFWAREVAMEAARRRADGQPLGGGLAFRHRLADRLVFHKLRARLGGNVQCMISGGAPLSEKINLFFNGAGLEICEGYGLTETAPVLTCNTPAVKRYGSVGRPVIETEIRIAADGEILARGPQVMLGYWHRPEATAEVIDKDGWFATGDIGRLDDDGFLFITDRKKDLIVTAGGKNIAPQPIENRFQTNKFVTQVVVIGDRRQYLSALVVPDFATLGDWAAAQGLRARTPAELVAEPRVQALFQEQLDHLNSELPGFSQIKKCSLLEQEFTLEAGELTPTMKVKRFAISRKYRDVINAMYPSELPGDED
ncbi:MAG TPA: long-chain fatty acid--CoA ligase [Candidatus Krumholzibacteria bacterium]|nr:long-chain fatty acid--CoA ligase [Candidatus Krumholzibacteria bacterium]